MVITALRIGYYFVWFYHMHSAFYSFLFKESFSSRFEHSRELNNILDHRLYFRLNIRKFLHKTLLSNLRS